MKKSVLIVATVAIGSLISATAVTEQDAKLQAEAARWKYVAPIARLQRLPHARYTFSAAKIEEKLWLRDENWHRPPITRRLVGRRCSRRAEVVD